MKIRCVHPAKFLKITLLFLAASCTNEEARPRDVLPEKKMIETLVDVQLFEAMLAENKMRDDSLAIFVKTNYAEIFSKHGIQEEQFQRTFEYYEQHPGKMDEMMTRVIDELSKIEAEVKGDKVEQAEDSDKN